MQITVPFLYTARLLKKQNRIEKDYPILGKQTFEIPELSAKNVGLVARAEGFSLTHQHRKGDPFQINYYLANKKDMVSRLQLNLDRYYFFKETNVTAENLQVRLDEWAKIATVKKKQLDNDQLRTHPDQLRNPFVTYGELNKTNAEPENGVANVINWISDTREKNLAILTTSLGKSICVDGLVYATSNGPFYRIDNRYNQQIFQPHLSVGAEKPNSFYLNRLYGPLNKDAALAAFGGRDYIEEGTIEVFMPWVFERTALYNNLYSSVAKYAHRISGNLSELPAEIIHTFADTKLLLDKFKGLDLDEAEQTTLLDQAKILFDQHQNYLGRTNIVNDKNPLIAFFNANDRVEEDQGVVLTLDDFEEEGSSFKL